MSKLLIVDDEEDITAFAKRFFQKRSIEVFVAGGGKTALELIDEHKPDLILLDIRMEEMTGIDVLRKIREANNETKVIMVSGVEDEDIINQAKSLSVTGFIHKPLVLEELEKIVLAELQ